MTAKMKCDGIVAFFNDVQELSNFWPVSMSDGGIDIFSNDLHSLKIEKPTFFWFDVSLTVFNEVHSLKAKKSKLLLLMKELWSVNSL